MKSMKYSMPLFMMLSGCTTTTSMVSPSAPLSTENVVEPSPTVDTSETTVNDQASVIIYFSNTGNTESVALILQQITESDLVEIQPLQPYTNEDLDYTNDDCRANREQNDESARPQIANIIDLDGYTTIYLGFPIWWGSAPRIIQTLLETYDFSGKTIAPFCTSGSSGISQAVRMIEREATDAIVTEGTRIDPDDATTELIQWLETIRLDG